METKHPEQNNGYLTEEELEILDKLFWKWEKTFNWDDSHIKKYTMDEIGNLIKNGNGED